MENIGYKSKKPPINYKNLWVVRGVSKNGGNGNPTTLILYHKARIRKIRIGRVWKTIIEKR